MPFLTVLGLTYTFLYPNKLQNEFDAQDCIVRVEVELKFLHLPKVYITKIL